MIEVDMTKDIRKYDTKVIAGLTTRQLACIGIACLYGVPLFFLLGGLDISVRLFIAILCMAPTIACGWCDAYGMHLELFVKECLLNKLTKPQKVGYRSENRYRIKAENEKKEKIERTLTYIGRR